MMLNPGNPAQYIRVIPEYGNQRMKIPGKPFLALQVISTTARSAFSFLIAAAFGPYTAAMTVVFSDT